jgi:hypothetical protein
MKKLVKGSKCQINIILVANPKNQKNLTHLKILLLLPKSTKRPIATVPPTGRWVEGSKAIEWSMADISAGETVEMQTQIELASVTSVNDSQEYSLQVQGECHAAQLTDIDVVAERGDDSQVDVTCAYARRFRFFYKDQV